MGKINAHSSFCPGVDYNIMGRAQDITKQISKFDSKFDISNCGIRYHVDSIYVAEPQYAHSARINVNGKEIITNCIFVEEFIQNQDGYYIRAEFLGSFTAINIPSLLGTFLGFVSEGPAPEILAERNSDGLWRPIRKPGLYKCMLSGTSGMSLDSVGNISVNNPIAFRYLGHKRVYTAKMHNLGAGRIDFETMKSSNGDTILNLDTQNALSWESMAPESVFGNVNSLGLECIGNIPKEKLKPLILECR